ncbi:hypothetical protein BpHYR1_050264 [Brachionus plicatilis]|uniref:Uncharacterized protein n=1 Tax=Brachionus plicatilis TaxID=10195 RepID=A0A3M7RVY6_BRAPC|nr:hypothetical protein BpHYR1_050264 [Brachionus plicatilis]
MQHSMLHF